MKIITQNNLRTLLLSCLIATSISFQSYGQSRDNFLPDQTRSGKLENGLTYYIKSNKTPEKRAEFYLIINAGAIQETDEQNGLAHFVEHMCFQGTKHFPGKALLDYFQSVGMAFGKNINAGTGTDLTAYYLMNTPVDRESVIDTAMLALFDFAGNVLFEGSEIDAERGVIREEWRTRRNAGFRIRIALNPYQFKGSKYAERDIIGNLDVIDNFKHETLRNFYKEWYRPDLQSIIVVGDINVDLIEQKIINQFSKLTSRHPATEKEIFEIPDNSEPIIAIATDAEAPGNSISVFYKHDYTPPGEKDLDYLKTGIIRSLYTQMLSQRLQEISRKEDSPFMNAGSYYAPYAGNKESYALTASPRNGKVLLSLQSVLVESERVKQHGFTEPEFTRIKLSMKRSYEQSLKEKDQQQNSRIANMLISHFLTGEPAPDPAFSLNLLNGLFDTLSLKTVNMMAHRLITDENIVVIITGPENDELKGIDKSKVSTLLSAVSNRQHDPYIDSAPDRPLLPEIPVPSGKSRTKLDESTGIAQWQLSNGVKVLFRKTDFKNDEVIFFSFSPGGSSLYTDEQLASADLAASFAIVSGLSSFSRGDLQKMMAGKTMVNVQPYIEELYEGFRGQCAPADLETGLQLLYLYVTDPRFDVSSINSYLTNYKTYLTNFTKNPDNTFRDSVNFIRVDRNPRKSVANLERFSLIDQKLGERIYRERFADAGDLTFVFVGNMEVSELERITSIYLGNLPSKGGKENWRDNNVRLPLGERISDYRADLKVPKVSSYTNYHGKLDYNLKNLILLDLLKHILDIRYTKTIREQEGGTYGVNTWITTGKLPVPVYEINMLFDCNTDQADKLKGIIHREIRGIAEAGPETEDFGKAVEILRKQNESNMKENSFWMNAIVNDTKFFNGRRIFLTYEKVLSGIEPEDVRKLAQMVIKHNNTVEVTMRPVK